MAKKPAPAKEPEFIDNPEENPEYQVEENDDGRLKVSFYVPRRFVEWIELKARLEGATPEETLGRMVRQAWAQDPMRRSAGGSLPASEFKA